MPMIAISERVPTAGQDYLPAAGTFLFVPTLAQNASTLQILPKSFTVQLDRYGNANVFLAPTTNYWAWQVTKTITGQDPVTFTVAVKATDSQFVNLVQVDPLTLLVTGPVPQWVAQANGTVVSGSVNNLGHLILTRTDGTTSDAGSVVGPAGTPGQNGQQGNVGLTADGIDPRAYGAVFDGVHDDTSAIQSALNTGRDVVIAPLGSTTQLSVKVTSTLALNSATSGQRFLMHNSTLFPTFIGDLVQITNSRQIVLINVDGTNQISGVDTDTAAIVVGRNVSCSNSSVAFSTIKNYKGNGLIWVNGPMLDMTDLYVTDVTRDGIRAENMGTDNNHGLFANTHVIRAAGNGYRVKYSATANLGSRSNVFVNAKAFQCGTNFLIETRDNVGSIFSELGTNPDQFGANSQGNYIQLLETAASYENFIDNGVGNRLEGFSSFNLWDTKTLLARKLHIQNLFGGTRELSQTALAAFSDTIIGAGVDTTVTYSPETGKNRTDKFVSRLGLPGTSGLVIGDSDTGMFTIPAGQASIAAGATLTLVIPGATTRGQFANLLVSMFGQPPGLVVSGYYDASFNPTLQIYNSTTAAIGVASKIVRWAGIQYTV